MVPFVVTEPCAPWPTDVTLSVWVASFGGPAVSFASTATSIEPFSATVAE